MNSPVSQQMRHKTQTEAQATDRRAARFSDRRFQLELTVAIPPRYQPSRYVMTKSNTHTHTRQSYTRRKNIHNPSPRSAGENLSDVLPGALGRDWLQTDFEWDVVPLPLSPFSFRRPAFGEGSGLVAATGAAVTPDLVLFLEWVASTEGQQAVMRSGRAFPASPKLWDQAMFYASGPPENRAAFLQAIQEWTFFAFPQATEADLNRLIAPLTAILAGQMDPEPGLRAIQVVFDELYGE